MNEIEVCSIRYYLAGLGCPTLYWWIEAGTPAGTGACEGPFGSKDDAYWWARSRDATLV